MLINAIHTDPKIAEIRATVSAKNSKVPFLLLPVRIETRFMKVTKPIDIKVDENIFGELLIDLSQVDELLLQPIEKMSAAKIKTAYKKIAAAEKVFKTKAKQIKSINKEQKTWLSQIKTNITKRIKSLTTQLPRPSSTTFTKLNNRLKASIKAIDDSAPTKSINVNSFVSAFAGLEKQLQSLDGKRTPYTNPKNKKILYGFVENKIKLTKEFYEGGLYKITNIQSIESNQLSKIKSIHEKVKKHLRSINANLGHLHKDNNWRAFLESRQHLLKIEIEPLFNSFEHEVITHLKDKSETSVIDSNQYLFTSLNLQRVLTKFQYAVKEKDANVKELRKVIKNRVAKLVKYQSKLLIGTKEQQNQMKSIWRKINTDLSKIDQALATTRTATSNMKFSLNQSRGTIKSVLNNQKINLSTNVRVSFNYPDDRARSFMLSTNFAKFSQAINGLQSSGRQVTIKELKAITDFRKKLEVHKRKKTQFSKSDNKGIQRQAAKMRRSANSLEFSSAGIKEDFISETKSIDKITKAIDQQQSPITDSITFIPPVELKDELWVRIFPDDIFVHTHEEQLTKQEIEDGKRYWKTIWAFNFDDGLSLGAWRSMCASYGSKRAAWIVKTLKSAQSFNRRNINNLSPSKKIVENIKLLKATASMIKLVKSDFSFRQMRSAVDFDELNNKLLLALANYNTLIPKPQFLYFLEKAIGIKQNIYSRLQVIVKITNGSRNERGFQTTSREIQKILSTFEELQKVVSEIVPVRSDQYLQLQDEPYKYKDELLKPKDKQWNIAPHSKVLPKHFVVIAKNNDQYQIIHTGNEIPENLQMGLDPSTFDIENESENPFQTDAEGNLIVDEGMRWMVEFEEAIKKGMGMVIPLTEAQVRDGFDLLYVVGIHDNSSTIDQSKLEELINNHHYAALGMEFIKIGTATNNTSDANAGFSIDDIDPEESKRIEIEEPLFKKPSSTSSLDFPDGYRLANGLGIDSNVFSHINNSDLSQIGDAQAMHRGLWHATIGNFMEEMLDKLFTYDNISRTKDFFNNYVIARGYLPPLRIGRQPYGILPTTSYKKINFSNTFSESNLPELTQAQLKNPGSTTVQSRLDFRYHVRLKKLLNKLDYDWRQIREAEVNHAGNMEDKDDPQAAFVNMLGLTANSTDFYFRYGVNINDRSSGDLATVGTNFIDTVTYSPTTVHNNFVDFVKGGYFSPSYEYQDEVNPYDDEDRQTTSMNSRIRDQFHDSRIFTFRFLDRHSFVNGIWVNEDENEAALPKIIDDQNYIEWLLNPDHNIFFDVFNSNNIDELPSNSILFLLLRHSLLLAYREAGLQVCQSQSLMGEEFRRLLGAKESYIDYTHTKFRTKWTHLLRRLVDLESSSFYTDGNNYKQNTFYKFLKNKGNKSVADYVHDQNLRNQFSGHSQHNQYIGALQDAKDSIAHLTNLPTKDLAILLSEHLDVSTYRLDAWISGLANKRLEESRARQKKGIFIGAYGWVENLRPGGERKEVTKLPEDFISQKETVYTDEDNEGYIHAPSINHAISAAILRAGYLANDDAEGDLTNRMAVNLSSARVRKALYLIEGLRGGLDLPALLGYQFERGIHERYQEVELDKFILPFRQKFPLTVPVEVQGDEEELETISSVVHGVNLLEALTSEINEEDAAQTSLYEYLTHNNFENCPDWLKDFVNNNSNENAGVRQNELKTIIKEVDEMADAFDALGDLAISESVYQIVNGNHVRAAAMLSALGEGSLMPNPQIATTPRSGTVVTHKVLLQMEPKSGLVPGWGSTVTARSIAEPTLNHWLAETLGDPTKIQCVVESDSNSYTLSYADLDIQPIDLLFMISSNKDQGNNDLTDIVKHRIRTAENIPNEVGLIVNYKVRSPAWSSEIKSFYETDLLLQQIKAALHDAKATGFTDVSIPSESPDVNNPDQYDLAEISDRIIQIVGKAKQDLNNMISFIESKVELTSPSDFNSAYNHLLKASQYGIVNTLADLPRVDDAEHSNVLLDRMSKSIERLTKRIEEAEKHQSNSFTLFSSYQKVSAQIAAAKAILTKNFIVLPLYETSNKAQINEQLNLASSEDLLRNSACTFPMEEWLQGIADVRTKMYHIEMIRMIKNASGTDVGTIRPVQFPFNDGDYWLGQEFPKSYELGEDKLSVIFINPNLSTSGTKQAGILVDEWVEIIPIKQQTTGITFQYDQPDASPPQSLLLAVSPNPITNNSKWAWDDLCYILEDTLSLARNRTVEPDQLENSMYGQLLPAIAAEVVPPQIIGDDDGDNENLMGTQVILDFASNLPEENTV